MATIQFSYLKDSTDIFKLAGKRLQFKAFN